MILYNTTIDKQSVQAFGKWFTFNAGQVKTIDDKFADFIVKDKKQYGIVALPEAFEDLAFKDTEEGKAIMTEKMVEGRTNRINHIKFIMHNEEVSLRQDLEKSGLRINPNLFSSASYVNLLKEYNEYKRSDDDVQRERVNEIQRLKSAINKE